MEDKDLNEYLNSLILWAENYGYFIDFKKRGDNCICLVNKVIEINSSAPLKFQVYCLLHECGHVLIANNKSFWNFNSSKESKDRDYKVFTIIEEIEAWKRGFNLAQRLNIPISKEEWDIQMSDAIYKYIKWAAN